MNFLAHLFLSGNNDEIKVGNFIGDFVKGRKYENYPEGIKKGILLHRYIDSFIDQHPIARQSAKRMKPLYNRYSGIVIDIFYDHFLAKNFNNYCPTNLSDYAQNSYKILSAHKNYLPQTVRFILPRMSRQKRLESYADIDGIKRALNILSNRSSLPHHSRQAIKILEEDYSGFEFEFQLFIKEAINFVKQEHQIRF